MRVNRSMQFPVAVFLAVSLAAPRLTVAQVPASRRAAPAPADAAEWRTYNRSYDGQRFSPLTQLTTANVAQLRRVCTYDTKEQVSFQTGPLVVDGTMIFTTDTATYAIDAATCAPKWKRGTGQKPTFLGAHRGVAYDGGRVFRGAGVNHVQALDAKSGRVVWDVAVGEARKGQSMPMAPIAWNGMLFIGNAGGDAYAVTGHVWALDERDGRVVWRFDVVPDSGPARQTWRNTRSDVPPTGGAFWTTFGLDTARATLFVPAGNPAPDFLPELRPGDNLYTNSVIGLDAKTGRLIGYIQLIKHDFHDWDVSTGPVVLTTRGGRSLVVSANKDGLLSAIDRPAARQALAERQQMQQQNPTMLGDITRVLALRYQTPTTTRENVDLRTHASGTLRFCPGSQGGSEWNGPSYDSTLNLLVVGANDWCTSVRLIHPDSLSEATWTGDVGQGFGVQDTTAKWQGWITAMDADSGGVVWKHRTTMPMLAGVTTTAGGLVLTGELTGDVVALDAKTGRPLWRDRTGNAIGGGVITYEARGRQYVAAAAGMKSPIWPVPHTTAQIVVYGLR
ncbi:MAG TPA: PQQ-binding-like beta-propeller repeat protein [Gemmatimonadales bacterium]|nr:PQQ-binding-like beta-propeller repeat protein [Gemmatimonadales bacterium]